MAVSSQVILGSRVSGMDEPLRRVVDLLWDGQTWRVERLVIQGDDEVPIELNPNLIRAVNPIRRELVAIVEEGVSRGSAINQPAAAWEKSPRQLRSVGSLRGLLVEAQDGPVGHLEDVLIEAEAPAARGWEMRYLVLDTGGWLRTKRLLVPALWVKDVDWDAKRLQLVFSRAKLLRSPEFNPALPLTGEYETQLHTYFGLPR